MRQFNPKWVLFSFFAVLFWRSSEGSPVQIREIDIAQRSIERKRMQSEERGGRGSVPGTALRDAFKRSKTSVFAWKKGKIWQASHSRLEVTEQVEPFRAENALLNSSGLSVGSSLEDDLRRSASHRVLGRTTLRYEVVCSESDLLVLEVTVLDSDDPLLRESFSSLDRRKRLGRIHLLMDPRTLKLKRKLWLDSEGRALELSVGGLLLKRSPLEFLRIDLPQWMDRREITSDELDAQTLRVVQDQGINDEDSLHSSLYESVDSMGRPVDFQWDSDRAPWPSWMKGQGFIVKLDPEVRVSEGRGKE